ncbi:ImmA/IrrE family metallo-endopeptidase [Streptomyces sp. NRRL WC-3742]|uniref:ImmA/IrrE family metallo-endopeptidase n=1 Tax=Streptomyces sp. NRRL WC-3742 TaxID=1463934 RepID=UPI0004C6D4BC|nr:ImmA/IrrE family metallo-endopeptidase [Streptomyces sp. NRRL WC-3742]
MGQRWTKKALEDLALEERARIQVGLHQPIDLARLADEYGIPVYPLSELGDSGCPAETLEYFASERAGTWSAALVPVGTARFIVENSSHNPQRRRSNVAHEMAHLLLEHEFSSVVFTDGGCRSLDPIVKTQEAQALALSGELLVPMKAAIEVAFRDWTDEQVATRFDVSIEFARMRMNASGARTIVSRARAKQRRSGVG